MIMSEATWLAFAVFSGLRTVSYVPQIARIAKDRNGASAISYPTWMLWTCANASTAAYAAVNLADLWLAVVQLGVRAVLHRCHRPDRGQATPAPPRGMRGWDKVTQRSIYQPDILIVQVLTPAALIAVGRRTRLDAELLTYALPGIAGAVVGLRIFRRLTDLQLQKLVNVASIVSGVALALK